MIGWRSKTPTAQADKPKGFDDFDLRLGDLMRGERATLGKSLLDVQRELKIKASYIAAIENADISAFDTPGFIAGFVRSYARYLGMDPDLSFQRFCVEARFEPAHGMLAAASSATMAAARARKTSADDGDYFANPATPFSPSGPTWASQIEPGAIGSVMVLVAVAGAISFGAWTVLQEVQRVTLSPVDQAPVVVTQIDPIQSAGNGTAPVDPISDATVSAATSAATGLDRLYAARPLDVPVMVSRDGPIAAIDPGTTGVMAQRPDDGTRTSAELVQVLAAATAPVEVFAVRPSWVQISSADGKVIFEAILNAGERYVVPTLDATPVLRSGNSGSIYFLVEGQTFGPASPGANVVKNVALSAEALQTAYATADLTTDPDLQVFVENLAQPVPPTAP